MQPEPGDSDRAAYFFLVLRRPGRPVEELTKRFRVRGMVLSRRSTMVAKLGTDYYRVRAANGSGKSGFSNVA